MFAASGRARKFKPPLLSGLKAAEWRSDRSERTNAKPYGYAMSEDFTLVYRAGRGALLNRFPEALLSVVALAGVALRGRSQLLLRQLHLRRRHISGRFRALVKWGW